MKWNARTLMCAAALALAITPAAAEDFVIDTVGAHAGIHFRVSHLGFSWVTGSFDKFTGTFKYDENEPAKSEVAVEIDMTSVNTRHAERDKHLRTADFFDVAKYPTASFKSTSVKPSGDGKAKVEGNLTLRGVTKPVVIDAEYVGGGDDPWGGFRQGFTGTTKLTLADFGIPDKLGPTAREVVLTLDIEGVRQ